MLELRHISKRFGDREILSDISLSINQGEIVSILGPSGCGKTTLLNLILGLTDLTEGQLIYDGEDLSHVSMKDRGFNIVFQDFALFPNLNARENILYGLRNNPNASTREVRWVSEKWTSRNKLGDNYVLGGIHYETSTSTVHCRVQKERCQSCC